MLVGYIRPCLYYKRLFFLTITALNVVDALTWVTTAEIQYKHKHVQTLSIY